MQTYSHLTKLCFSYQLIFIIRKFYSLRYLLQMQPDQDIIDINNWDGEQDAESGEPSQPQPTPRKPRVLLAACGCFDTVKFGYLCTYFNAWAEVKAVLSENALFYIQIDTVPFNLNVYTEEHERIILISSGDDTLHLQLSMWADILLIAPLSANALAKIAGGVCDDLLTHIVRAWNYSKPVFAAPSMNTYMWLHPLTERHFNAVKELGMKLFNPAGGTSSMSEPSLIYAVIREYHDRFM